MEIETSAGSIIIEKNTDPGAPGVSVSLRKKGKSYAYDLVYVEVKEDEEYRVDDETEKDVCIYIYADTKDEDYTNKFVIKGDDIGSSF